MADPWQFWSPERIAAVTGAPLANVKATWPFVLAALEARGIADRPVQVAALATIGVETGNFRPIPEYASGDEYEGRIDLGNTQPGDGRRFKGRGFIQITGRANYTNYGELLDIDLVGNPDLALDPNVAADIFAAYFTDHRIRWFAAPAPLMSCVDLARAGEWRGVRVAVNGGENGLAKFLSIVQQLGDSMPKVTYNRNEPAHPQDETYDCSQDSLEWALYALGRGPSDDWLEETMIAEGIMSKERGLLDASGGGLAAFVRRQYGEFGYDANNEPSISWEWAVHEGAANDDGSGHVYPVLLGGRHFGAEGHWVGLRDYDPTRDVLLLANPANGYDGIGQTMTREQFEARGPWSAVRVWHPDLLESEPAPPPPLPPAPPTLTPTEIKAALLDIVAPSDQEIVGRVLREKIVALADRIG